MHLSAALTIPASPPVFDDGPAERTYLAEERTFGAWLRTALTMLVTALAVARFIYEREPSIEALAISLLLLVSAGGVLVHARPGSRCVPAGPGPRRACCRRVRSACSCL